MIVKDFFMTRDDGVNLYRTYSDSGFYIRQEQTDILYGEAVDVENSPYTYVETDIPVEGEELTDSEALDIIMGREPNEPSDGD